MDQESGSRPYLRDAMQDIANTVEYLIAKNKWSAFLLSRILSLNPM